MILIDSIVPADFCLLNLQMKKGQNIIEKKNIIKMIELIS